MARVSLPAVGCAGYEDPRRNRSTRRPTSGPAPALREVAAELQLAKLSQRGEGWLRNPASTSPLARWSHPVPHHLLCKGHLKSLPLNTALDASYNESDNKTDHGKSGDNRTKHFEMKLVVERSLRSCSDALRSNPSPFFLAGLLIFYLFFFTMQFHKNRFGALTLQ